MNTVSQGDYKNSSDETWTKLDSLNAFACESRCIFYIIYR